MTDSACKFFAEVSQRIGIAIRILVQGIPPGFKWKQQCDSRFFDAFITTELINQPRVPINAERIGIVLGKDEEGRPLEISINLRRPDFGKKKLKLTAYIEPLKGPMSYSPVLIAEPGMCINECELSIKHEMP